MTGAVVVVVLIVMGVVVVVVVVVVVECPLFYWCFGMCVITPSPHPPPSTTPPCG